MQADDLHVAAAQSGQLNSHAYRESQDDLFQAALKLVNSGATNDD